MMILWDTLKSAQKIALFEQKILGHLDKSCQAFDLEEVMSVGYDDNDRLYCWNAAMNLVEQGRVHLLQITEKDTPQTVRWVLMGYAFKVLDNKTFRPPGKLQ